MSGHVITNSLPFFFVSASNELCSDSQKDILSLIDLERQILATSPGVISASAGDYFGALATLCQSHNLDPASSKILVDAVSQPFALDLDQGLYIHPDESSNLI